MDEERLLSLKELEGRLGYRFNDVALSRQGADAQILCSSIQHLLPWSRREKVANEVLEFLGRCGPYPGGQPPPRPAFPDAHEGILSLKRSHLVRQSTLAHLSRELQLEKHLLLGKGELLNGGRKKSSILANTYEALIGAIYMDSGFRQAMDDRRTATDTLSAIRNNRASRGRL